MAYVTKRNFKRNFKFTIDVYQCLNFEKVIQL